MNVILNVVKNLLSDAHINNVIPRSEATWESKAEADEIERPSDRETERPRDRAKSLSTLIASSLWSLWSQGLEVSETVDGSANLEILRCAQHELC